MKSTQPWHDTGFGVAARWLGSVKLAVPVMALVAAALAWGTYLESTQGAKVAKAIVYGSSWFMALMVLVSLSLIFAVVTRYPWGRRHIGFMTVHASLIALITGGFWSLYARTEGRLALQEGTASAVVEMEQDVLELVEHEAGQFRVLAAIPAPHGPAHATLGGLQVRITDWWENTREEIDVLDGGPEPYRAFELSADPAAARGIWIGDEARGGPGSLDGIKVRVLAPEIAWRPPPSRPSAPAGPEGGYAFEVGGRRYPLAAEGTEAFPGWTVVTVRRYSQATVAADGIAEGAGPRENPAIDVTVTDGKGSTERHTAFQNFPDLVLSKAVEGTAASGARLSANRPAGAPAAAGDETLVVYGQPGAVQIAHIARDGSVTTLQQDRPLPWSFECGPSSRGGGGSGGVRHIALLREVSRAHERSRFTRAPAAAEHRSALLVSLGDSSQEPTPLAFKSMIPAPLGNRTAILRYGPRTVTLPFAVRLDHFRKTDYPGTDMAMAFESDVSVADPAGAERRTTVSMNSPLIQSGWKVYQSGYVGEHVSIFSVMRDPGLPLTYTGATGLCIGILITFYGRGLSWGHPGIPGPFVRKEKSDVPLPPVPAVAVPDRAGPVAGPREPTPAIGGAVG